MRFFLTSDSAVHAGRIGGVLYLISLLITCSQGFNRYCLSSILFTPGWWITFGGKEVMRAPYSRRQMAGMAVTLVGLGGMFYFTWSQS